MCAACVGLTVLLKLKPKPLLLGCLGALAPLSLVPACSLHALLANVASTRILHYTRVAQLIAHFVDVTYVVHTHCYIMHWPLLVGVLAQPFHDQASQI